MTVPPDYTIATSVRTVLDRLWIEAADINFGSVNGVVYVRGELRRQATFPPSRAQQENAGLVDQLERQLRAINGVKDVSIEVSDLATEEELWQSTKQSAD